MPTYPWPLYHCPARLESAQAVCWLRGTPAFAAADPGPFVSRKEYGSKPASTANRNEKLPLIGSIPLTPMLDWLNPLGARPHSDDLLLLRILYETPEADSGSKGAPWLCQPPPTSIVP